MVILISKKIFKIHNRSNDELFATRNQDSWYLLDKIDGKPFTWVIENTIVKLNITEEEAKITMSANKYNL